MVAVVVFIQSLLTKDIVAECGNCLEFQKIRIQSNAGWSPIE